MAEKARTIPEWEVYGNVKITERTGLSLTKTYTHEAWKTLLETHKFTGINFNDRRAWLRQHGYTDDTYLIERAPIEQPDEAVPNDAAL